MTIDSPYSLVSSLWMPWWSLYLMQIINKRIKGWESACPKHPTRNLTLLAQSQYPLQALLSDTVGLQCILLSVCQNRLCLFLEALSYLDDRLIAVHVFFVPALFSGVFFRNCGDAAWHMPLVLPPPMKADPLRVTDLTTGGEWNNDCGNIF